MINSNCAYWRVHRQLVSPEVADSAYQEFCGLRDSTYVTEDLEDVGQGLTRFQVDGWDEGVFDDKIPNAYEDMNPLPTRNLRRVHYKAAALIPKRPSLYFVHLYEPEGQLEEHPDSIAKDAVLVNLTGVALMGFRNPANGRRFEYTLRPGDAAHILNPDDPALRPLHWLENIGDGIRASMAA